MYYYYDTDSSSCSSAGGANRLDSADFDIDRDGFVNVYTDGACFGNGGPGAAAGIGVWFGDDHYLNVSAPIPDGYNPTNQVAEILAVTEAARVASDTGVRKLMINVDSHYIIKSLTQWMLKWRRNGWRNAKGHPLVNREELMEMDDALSHLTFELTYVPAHSGNHGNDMADKLAKAGARAYRRR